VAQGIVDRARLVHLLTATTPAVLAGWITIDPARAVHVPHPNYDGAYGPLPPRAEARRRLGLDERLPSEGGEVVVGLLGYLADRKGGIDLLDAFTALPDPLPDGRRLRLVIGGMPSGRRSEELIRRAMGDARVVSRFGFIPDEALPELLATLDAAVVPYGAYLNSGWLHLALTYGIPVIAPDDRTTNEVARPGALRTFAAGDAGSLGAALAGAGDLATETARRDARASVEDLGSRRLSEAFVDAVLAATEDASPVPVPGPR
jgi:glycosyltransferase involved in cell wall biosynthesis